MPSINPACVATFGVGLSIHFLWDIVIYGAIAAIAGKMGHKIGCKHNHHHGS